MMFSSWGRLATAHPRLSCVARTPSTSSTRTGRKMRYGADAAIVAGFYRRLWAPPEWCATERGWRSRVREYQHLVSQPHPEYGRTYGVGRVFARLCGASHDLPMIELGATAFVEQLAPILGLLRSVRVAGAGEVAPAEAIRSSPRCRLRGSTGCRSRQGARSRVPIHNSGPPIPPTPR